MKRLVILGLTLSSFTAFYAQTLQDAVKKVQNERYELAQKDFESLVKNNPTSVENAFFFGNYYVTIEENAKAIEQFKAAAAKNPEDKLAKVAAAKATYFSGDTTAAGKAFCELIKATKNKNAMVLYRIAETYATGPTKNYNEAEVLLNQAIKLDPSNQDALMLLGDVILAQSTSRVSECVGKYNEALKINANNVDAIVRKARIYERVGNNDAAIQGYEQSERLDPNFATAFRYHAELSIKQKKFDQAQVLWEKYLALNNDVEARTRYAASLYAGERYGDAFTQYKKIEEMGLSTFQTKRAIVYTFIESKEKTDSSYCAEALKYSDDFFALAPANRVTARDYKYRVETYLKMKNFDAALVDMMKATAIDSSSMADQFTQLGSYYSKQKNYDKTIEIYTTKEKFAAAKMKTNDYFELAKAYYFNKTPNYLLADTSFAKMLVLSPNFAVGYAWRGRCMANTDLNPNARTFAGKPHYEKFLTTLTEKELQDPRYKDFLLEANRYLGDYYVNSKEGKDLAKAKTHWGNVQTLDPNDKQAKAFFAAH